MIHNIRYRVFVYENEDLDLITQALLNILPTAEIEAEEVEGLLEEPMVILSGMVSKKRQTKEFLNNLLAIDKDQLTKLYNDLDKKMDEKGNLFLRLSKDFKPKENSEESNGSKESTESSEDLKADISQWRILDGGDSIHLKIKIAAYPAKKEVALKKLDEVFDEEIKNN
ncbi:MAG: RNA-binding domain-containing protein [Methanobacteriaceae archaeon]|nr:RNA-binding domain-containing protein [Methanobacteriaceae archaeon]